MDTGTQAAVGLIRTAAELLAEIGDEGEDVHRVAELARPLVQPNRHGTLVRTNRYPKVRKSTARPARLCELVDDCDRLHVAKGGCGTHYYRLRTYGHPLGGIRPGPVSLGRIEGLGNG